MKALSCQSPHVCGADASHQQKRLQSFCVDVLVTFWWPPRPPPACGSSFSDPATSKYFLDVPATPTSDFLLIQTWFSGSRKSWIPSWSHLSPVSVFFTKQVWRPTTKYENDTLYFKGLSLTALLIINFSENLLCDRYCSKHFTSNWILLLLFYARGNRPVKFVA